MRQGEAVDVRVFEEVPLRREDQVEDRLLPIFGMVPVQVQTCPDVKHGLEIASITLDGQPCFVSMKVRHLASPPTRSVKPLNDVMTGLAPSAFPTI